MMHSDKKYLALAVTLVALIILFGGMWISRSNSTSQNAYAQGLQPVQPASPLTQTPRSEYGEPVTDPAGTPTLVATRATFDVDGYYPSVRRPIYVRQAVDTPPAETPLEPADSSTFIDDQPGYTGSRVHRIQEHRGRSKKKSVAIVAGSAGVGAAIGAVAAGGKGAALGGLSGGAAGFLYDRVTHKH